MKTVKDEIKQIMENLPDDLTYEEFQYHIYVHQKIQNGLKDAREGRVISNDEMKKRMAKWIEK
jgi:predicted transcriptional regulator